MPSDDDASVGGFSSAVSGAVVDDVGSCSGGLDADSESRELVVPRDEGLIGGLEGVDGAFVDGMVNWPLFIGLSERTRYRSLESTCWY